MGALRMSAGTGLQYFVIFFLTVSWMACKGGDPSPSVSPTPSPTSTTGGGGLPDTTSGWETIISSAEPVITNPEYSGGVASGDTSGINSLFFVDEDTAWAVGNLGEVIKTTDGGASATTLSAPDSTSGDLRAVFATSVNTVWIAGKDSANSCDSIWSSSNGGTSWSLLVRTSNATVFGSHGLASLDRVHDMMADSSGNVIAVGELGPGTPYVLGCTSEGSCSVLYDSTQYLTALRGISTYGNDPTKFLAAGYKVTDTGWDGVVIRSLDNGSTWNRVALASGGSGNKSLKKIRCLGDACVAVGDSGVFLVTTDGGSTWDEGLLSVGNSEGYLNSVAFSESGNIWVGGRYNSDDSLIYFSNDAGATWTRQTTSPYCTITDIVMMSDTVGFAGCATAAANTGALLYTNSGGR